MSEYAPAAGTLDQAPAEAGAGPQRQPRDEPMSSGEVRRRATSGAVVLATQGGLLQAISFGANIALARLLVPSDFGLIALGSTVVVLGVQLSGGGLGAALIRRAEAPARRDLEAVLGLQIAASLAFGALVALTAVPFGAKAGLVAAIMVASLPVTAFRTPGTILLERKLGYRTLAVIETAEAIAYYAFAIIAVALGAGVWGLAVGTVFRELVGSALTVAVVSPRIVIPRLEWQRLRGILSFGARFQAVNVVNFVHDQGLSVGIAAIGGLTVLGIWSLAYRAIQSANVVLAALWRVSFPAMSRLVAAGEDVRPIIERATAISAVAIGSVLTVLVGAGPGLVSAVFGARWTQAASALPPACLGLMIGGPISIAAVGYLFAVGDAQVVLRSTIRHTLAHFAVAFALLPVLGLWALGLGTLSAYLVESVIVGRAAAARTGARVVRPLAIPLAAFVIAGATGWLTGNAAPATIPVALACAAGSGILYLGLLAVADRALLLDTVGMLRRAFAGAVR